VDCVPEKDGAVKLPFEDRQEGQSGDARRLAHQTCGKRQAEKAVSHWSPVGICRFIGVIHMKGIGIPGETREQDDVCFGNRSPRAFPFIADDEFIVGADRPGMERHVF
jgi:hypothetical protein